MNRNALDQALRFLELLPADAPEWSADVPDFLSSVSEIVDRKRDERESVVAVEALNATIAELHQFSSHLEYLELDLSNWAAPTSFSSEELAQVRERLNEFSGLLREYDPVPKMGSSISETQRLRDEHDAVTRSLIDLTSELDSALSAGNAVHQGPVESTPDHQLHIEAQVPDRIGGLSDIRLSEGTSGLQPNTKELHDKLGQ